MAYWGTTWNTAHWNSGSKRAVQTMRTGCEPYACPKIGFSKTFPRDWWTWTRPEVIVVESHAQLGAQLAIYDESGTKIAATPHIGTRFRWLAPIGAADLDGDGYTEIAYIDRPHLAKTLRIWRYKEGALAEIASLPGLTNHRIGEDYISGGLRDCGETPELITASADWSRIISVTYDKGWAKSDLGPFTGRQSVNQALQC